MWIMSPDLTKMGSVDGLCLDVLVSRAQSCICVGVLEIEKIDAAARHSCVAVCVGSGRRASAAAAAAAAPAPPSSTDPPRLLSLVGGEEGTSHVYCPPRPGCRWGRTRLWRLLERTARLLLLLLLP